MANQVIISIGREFGSAGHEIAQKLSEIYGFTLYDQDLLNQIASEYCLDERDLHGLDEKRKNPLLARTVLGMTNSPAENVANLQFDFLRRKADSGESFVVVGRCSDAILKGYPGFVSIFILGDMDKKIERIMKLYGLSRDKAQSFIEENDKKRKRYHNSHCDIKWGDSRGYDLSINGSKLGIDESVKLICRYIEARMKNDTVR